MTFIPCTLKQLPTDLLHVAARTAISISPCNGPLLGSALLEPEHLALSTTRWWGAGGVKLGVAFLDTQDAGFKARILSHMNAWNQYANVHFSEASRSAAQVRLARQRGGGYWSYLGTDILHIPAGQPTMNLDSFSMQTPESEYHRVVRHETGHTLGFVHEHLRRQLVRRLDPQRTIAYFGRTQGWSAEQVQAQVLTPVEESTLTATPDADVLSIMCYQLPGEITVDGQPIPGGTDIDPSDGLMAGKLYPLAVQPPPPPPPTAGVLTIDPVARTVAVPAGWTVKGA